jgi:hypothetical protein
MTDYAYAVTILRDIQEKAKAQNAAAQNDADLKSVFGPWITAGQRFYGLRDQVTAGKVCALLASDFATMVSVNNGEFAPAPLSLPRAPEAHVLSIQPKGTGKPIAVAAAVGERLLFAPDGFASFGKIAGSQLRVSDLVLKGLINKSIIVERSEGTALACTLRSFDDAEIAVIEGGGSVLGIPRAELKAVRLDTAAKTAVVSPTTRGWDRPLGSQYFLFDPLGFLLMGPSVEYGFKILPSVTLGVNITDMGLSLVVKEIATGLGPASFSPASLFLGLTSNQFFASKGPNHWYLEELVSCGALFENNKSYQSPVLFSLVGGGYRWRFPSGFFIDAAVLVGIGAPVSSNSWYTFTDGYLPLKLG